MTMTKTTHLPPRLSGPARKPPGAGAAGMGTTGLTPRDALRIVRKRKWLILLTWSICMGLAVTVTALWYVYFPSYTATVVLAVHPPRDIMAVGTTGVSEAIMDRLKRDQARLVLSPKVLGRVTRDDKFRETDWYRRNIDDVIRELEDSISVRPIPESSHIEVSMTGMGREKDELPNIVNVVAMHAAQVSSEVAVTEIQKDIRRLNTEQALLESKLTRIASQVAVRRGASDIIAMRERQGVSTIELKLVIGQVSEAEHLQFQAEAALQAVLASKQEGTLRDDPEVQLSLLRSPQYRGLTIRLIERKTQLANQLRNLGEGHRQVKATRGAIESIGAEVEEMHKRIIADAIRAVVQARKYNAALAAQQLAGLKTKQNRLKSRVRDLERQLGDIGILNKEYDRVERGLKQIERSKLSLGVRVREGKDRQSGGVSIIQNAIPPRDKSWPKWSLNMGLGFIGGLAIAFGLAFLLELADTSIRNPGDLARRTDLPLLGMVPHGDDLDEEVEDFRRVTLLEPQSPASEAFRQIRTNLLFSGPAEQRQVLLVTSPAPEDGRTTVVMNLAACIAQAGHRVLVVDANFRRPAIADMFPDAKEAGLSSALVGQANWRDVVSATGVPNCDVIAAGPLPPNPAELLGSSVMAEIIKEMKAEYDQVIFDGSPVMVVSDAVILATQVDATILVVRAQANSIGLVQRAAAQLRHVGAHLIGTILQGVRTTAGGYLRKNYQTYYEYHQRSLP